MEEIPKPFGFPDVNGFYAVHSSNRLTLDLAKLVRKEWNSGLECFAFSGYLIKDYPDDAKEEDYDWKYHFITVLEEDCPENTRKTFQNSSKIKSEFKEMYRTISSGCFWNHGPMNLVTIDYANQNVEESSPGTFLFSLVCSAVPLWEKPGILRPWEGYMLTPFEYLQQRFLQHYEIPEKENGVYVSNVTGDTSTRFILIKD